MSNRTFWQLSMSFILIAMLIVGCSPKAAPETRTGEWYASSNFGEFSFVVDSSGLNITSLTYKFKSCSTAILSGSGVFTATVKFNNGLPIKNNKFSLELTGIPSMDIKGTFSRDGTGASGLWTAAGCSGNWKAGRSYVQPTDIPPQPTAEVVTIHGQVVFDTDRDGNDEIYMMDGSSSKQINLSNSPKADWAPDASPDGKKIVFASRRDGNAEIYVMNVDGSDQIKLTTNPGDDFGPKWSPDGKKIAFISQRGDTYEIYAMNANGSGEVNLTNNPSGHWGVADRFDWSPDGEKIAFSLSGAGDGTGDIYLVNADGSSLTNLTVDNPEMDNDPVWSPDGSQIAFETTRDGNYEVYVMNADGTLPTNLTNNRADDYSQIWSPDGKRIAFSSNREGSFDIYVMQADGSQQTRLADIPGDEFGSEWSPNGDQIVFYSGDEVFLANSDGSDWFNLTPGLGKNQTPSWLP